MITLRLDNIVSNDISADLIELGDKKLLTIPYKSIPEKCKRIEIALDFLSADASINGYYVVPYAKVCFLTEFICREDTEYITSENIIPMFGAKTDDTAYLLVGEGMRYDFKLKVKITDNKYYLSLIYDLDEISLYEDIVFGIYTLTGQQADYSGMARKYRELQIEKLGLIPLKERAKTEPIIAYAADNMPVIRIRLAWKPVPTPVLEQTLETEPEMRVACTFSEVEALIDEMKRQGIEKAEICLVGWNCKGHDGRWPQMFPVEEQLGGEEGLKRLVMHAKNAGYRIVCHTNSSDAYSIADCWNPAEIIKTKSGELSINPNSWSGGRMYNLCPRVAKEKYMPQNIDKIKALGFTGFHYIDVLTVVPPRTCFDTEHPLTAEQTAKYLNSMLQDMRVAIGGVGSEGAYDFAAKNLDFSLYVAYNILSNMPDIADEVIPLWQIVYNGFIFSNPSAETVNYMIKDTKNRLRFHEFGGIPAFYFYSRFVEVYGENWMGEEDMVCNTQEKRRESVNIIKKTLQECKNFADLRLELIEHHGKLADGVYETVYSCGSRVIVNYNDIDYVSDTIIVPANNVIRI